MSPSTSRNFCCPHLEIVPEAYCNHLQQCLHGEYPSEDHIAVAQESLPVVIHVGMRQRQKADVGNDDHHNEELTSL